MGWQADFSWRRTVRPEREELLANSCKRAEVGRRFHGGNRGSRSLHSIDFTDMRKREMLSGYC
jgi:hypothetical protein